MLNIDQIKQAIKEFGDSEKWNDHL